MVWLVVRKHVRPLQPLPPLRMQKMPKLCQKAPLLLVVEYLIHVGDLLSAMMQGRLPVVLCQDVRVVSL